MPNGGWQGCVVGISFHFLSFLIDALKNGGSIICPGLPQGRFSFLSVRWKTVLMLPALRTGKLRFFLLLAQLKTVLWFSARGFPKGVFLFCRCGGKRSLRYRPGTSPRAFLLSSVRWKTVVAVSARDFPKGVSPIVGAVENGRFGIGPGLPQRLLFLSVVAMKNGRSIFGPGLPQRFFFSYFFLSFIDANG